MATGDTQDLATRAQALLPASWFSGSAPILSALLQGAGAALSPIYGTLQAVKAQSRLTAASGTFLDVIAQDFFGVGGLTRTVSEADSAYRARIKWNLTAPRGTRAGMIEMLTQLTGYAPQILEPANTGDCGGYTLEAQPASGGGVMSYGGTAGVIVDDLTTASGETLTLADGQPLQAMMPPGPVTGTGAWGSLMLPFQFFVIVHRGVGVGIASLGGYTLQSQPTSGGGLGGYGSGAIAYVNPDMIPTQITDAYIYANIAAWTPAGSIAWVYITT